MEKKSRLKAYREHWPLYLMMLPGLLYLLINNYIPMAGIVIAFKKLNFAEGIFASPWAGFENFKFLFATKDAWIITRNTLLYNVAFILVNMVVGIAIAILICEVRSTKMKKLYQSAILLPFLMSMVILSYIVYALLSSENGLINNSILNALHMDPVQWYQEPKYWPFIIVFLNTWKGMGYGMVLYLASITGIDPSLYEAAVMDGATKAQQARHITLPAIKPVFIMMLILDCGKIFNSDFGLFFQVTGQLPASLYTTASTFDTFIYQAIQSSSPIGQTAAASFFQAICSCGTILFANWVVSKLDNENRII